MTASSSRFSVFVLIFTLTVIAAGCSASAGNQTFFGKTDPPRENVLRYVSGSEPESLDPQIPTGQNEARILMALFEGLIEYDPRTCEPIPALAERWEVNRDSSELVFYLRRNGRFSNGDPITAHDFVYTIRRGLKPALASRLTWLAQSIKHAEAYNSGAVFVQDPQTQAFLLEKDFKDDATAAVTPLSLQPLTSIADEYPPRTDEKAAATDSAFHQAMHAPARLVLPGSEKKRKVTLDSNEKLKAAIAGKTLVPVEAKDVGVEAVDDYTLRISLVKSAPYFISLMPHHFFRALHQKTVEQFGARWTDPRHIVTSGAFTLSSWKPYDRIIVARNPVNWDAQNIKLDRIVFLMLQDNPMIMNLYKAGELDATYNHTVPSSWLGVIGPMKDFMDTQEAAIDYYRFNTLKGPTKDIRVRKALNMSLNKEALAAWRNAKPLTALTPGGVFPGYPQPKGDPFDLEKAKRLLAEAGYRDAAGNFDPASFSAAEIELITNPDGSNIPYAEFIQAQWKQNLGVTIQIRIMEAKTFSAEVAKMEYNGISRTGWSADFLDPFNFLDLYSTPAGNNGTGWWDPKYAELLDEANRTIDHQKRYELLAQAEKLALEAQPVIPLTTSATRLMKKPYVKGFYPNPITLHPWKWVYIERDPAKWDYGVPDMSQTGKL